MNKQWQGPDKPMRNPLPFWVRTNKRTERFATADAALCFISLLRQRGGSRPEVVRGHNVAR